ncbi:MAG: hypothetical protein J6R77_02880, partial [Clostridia bacterium]|nr:hypothetical protein [Clostridia bacterium]
AGWVNLVLFGHVSYTHIAIRLKNGKELTYTVNDLVLKKEIATFKKAPCDIEALADLCCLSIAEKSKAKCKRELLKAVKSPDALQEVAFTTFHRRKKLKLEEMATLPDPSVQCFFHTWAEELEEDTLDYTTATCMQKRVIRLQAVEPTPEGVYQENLYTIKDKTSKKKLNL